MRGAPACRTNERVTSRASDLPGVRVVQRGRSRCASHGSCESGESWGSKTPPPRSFLEWLHGGHVPRTIHRVLQPSDWIALGAALIAVVALIFSGLSVRYIRRQTRAFESAEERARIAQRPVIGVSWATEFPSYNEGTLILVNEGPTSIDRVIADVMYVRDRDLGELGVGRSFKLAVPWDQGDPRAKTS